MTEIVPLYTAALVRAAEGPLLAAGEPLMQRASAALAEVIRGMLRPGGPRPRVLVLAGSGDNGGDALFAGAALVDVADVDVHLTRGRAHRAALATAVSAGARVVAGDVVATTAYDIVVDGILGIGASADPALRGGARDVVAALVPAIRSGRTRVVAVDLPSGVHPDDGGNDGLVLPATTTVAFGAVKAGLAVVPELVGRIVFVDLALPLVPATAVGEIAVERYRP